jgi:two-component system, OmpR family, phosphate regulon response regulator PhoB
MSKILLVDDEPDITELIALHLQKEGYQLFKATHGLEVMSKALECSPDLILLDLMLPGLDGYGVLKLLRKEGRTHHIPVIMLTAKGLQSDKLAGLELGADDYITKPFSPRELVLRIQSLLRRVNRVTSVADVEVGDCILDRRHLCLMHEGQRIDLTSIEFKLLAALMENPGKVRERGALLQEVWGYQDDTNTRTLDSHVKRLREKLGAKLEAHLVTARGHGYSWQV